MEDIRHLSKEKKIERIRKSGKRIIFNLSLSDLRGCDFKGCDLRGCDLSWSDLSGCDLSWSDLSGSNFRNAKIDYNTKFPKIKIKKNQVEKFIEKMFEVEK